jgi:alpha-L-rhamnosidase
MCRYVDYLESVADHHIVRIGKYGDWCPPGSTYPKRTPVALTSTFYYYHDTVTLSRIASVIGRSSEAQRYTERASAIAAAFNDEFNDHGTYAVTRMSPIDRHGSQTSQVLPLAAGLVPESDREVAIQVLLSEVRNRFDYHPDTGIVGMRYLLEELTNLGYPEVAYRVITQTSYPSLGYMIEQGATTLWERWENLSGVGMNSHNHIMFGSVDTWFYRTLCGIEPLAAEWRELRIAPWMPADMSHAAASLDTVAGRIAVAWRREATTVTMDIEVPEGSTATVVIPGEPRTLGEGTMELAPGGRTASVLPEGILGVEERGDVVEVTVGSGQYGFAWTDR